MEKWYEKEGKDMDVIVASRVRLTRNLKGIAFPDTLEEEQRRAVSQELEEALKGLTTITPHTYTSCHIDKLSEIQKQAMKERALISSSMVDSHSPSSLLVSSDESISIVINGNDHLRFQVSEPGNNLLGAYHMADRLDDFVNERYAYAFDERYGYMTAHPTNLGTGMKAYQILHLPLFCNQRRFAMYVGELSRFGIQIRGVVGTGDDNYGDLYVVFNQSTMGQPENSRINTIEKLCGQMVREERTLRQAVEEAEQLQRSDMAYKAYGMLRYARMLTVQEALDNISLIRMEAYGGGLKMENPAKLYEIMLGCLPYHIANRMNGKLNIEEMNQQRAEYVRTNLPKLLDE